MMAISTLNHCLTTCYFIWRRENVRGSRGHPICECKIVPSIAPAFPNRTELN
ncbi:unnamed protein product [Amoebophrya sp. A120]|nr:unnamed protein product [Amoebophrya sp. A120]|eukprot:GSA120T00025028001.1